MNILAAATLDLIDRLKLQTKGWRFDPLIPSDNEPLVHDELVITLTPTGSPTRFFVESAPTAPRSLIRAKTKNHLPRIIELHLKEDAKVLLTYWIANGWRQDEEPIRRVRWNRRLISSSNSDQLVYRTFRAERMIKPTSKRKPFVIQRDCINLASSDATARVAKRAAFTLEKSLQEPLVYSKRMGPTDRWRKLAVVPDGDNFLYDFIGPVALRARVDVIE